MINEEVKERLKVLGTVAWIITAILIVATIAYYLGAFKPTATGYFWYDVRRLFYFIFDTMIVPSCLLYVGFVLAKLFKSWLFPAKDEDHIPESVKELQEEVSRIHSRVDDIWERNRNVTIRVQELESKMIVICSILSLNKSDDLRQSTTDVLTDCAR